MPRLHAAVVAALLVVSVVGPVAGAVPTADAGTPDLLEAPLAQQDDVNATVDRLRDRLRTHDENLTRIRERLRQQNETLDRLQEHRRDRDRLREALHQHLRDQNRTMARLHDGNGDRAQRDQRAGQLGEQLRAQSRTMADLHEAVRAQNRTVTQLREQLRNQLGAAGDGDAPQQVRARQHLQAQLQTADRLGAHLRDQARRLDRERARLETRRQVIAQYRNGSSDAREQRLDRARTQLRAQERAMTRLDAAVVRAEAVQTRLHDRVRAQNRTVAHTRAIYRAMNGSLGDVETPADAAQVRDRFRERARTLDQIRSHQRDQLPVLDRLRDRIRAHQQLQDALREQLRRQNETLARLRAQSTDRERAAVADRLRQQLRDQNRTMDRLHATLREANETLATLRDRVRDRERAAADVDDPQLRAMVRDQVREQRHRLDALEERLRSQDRLLVRERRHLEQRHRHLSQYRDQLQAGSSSSVEVAWLSQPTSFQVTETDEASLLETMQAQLDDQVAAQELEAAYAAAAADLVAESHTYVDEQLADAAELRDLYQEFALTLGDVEGVDETPAADEPEGPGLEPLVLGVGLIALVVIAATLLLRRRSS